MMSCGFAKSLPEVPILMFTLHKSAYVDLTAKNVGVREVADHVWLISFMHYDLGFFDDTCTRVECAPNPFSAKVSTMSPV